jgi:hypothetical protein
LLYVFLARLVFHLKRGTLFWPALPAIIEARGRNIRMPQPLLHFESVSKTFAGQHPPAPLAAAGVIGLPAPGFFLSKSFDGPQACGPCIFVSFFYA